MMVSPIILRPLKTALIAKKCRKKNRKNKKFSRTVCMTLRLNLLTIILLLIYKGVCLENVYSSYIWSMR